MKVRRIALLAVAGIVASVAPTDLDSCGPFLPRAIFVLPHGPPHPRAGFAQGELGVIQPEFRTAYLVIAYRYLSGLDLSSAEVDALFPHYGGVVQSQPIKEPEPASGAPLWLYKRNQFTSSPAGLIDVYKPTRKGGFIDFPNCLESAFTTAAKTLDARAAAWGPQSAFLHDWIAAQDQVFANCSGAEEQPAPAPASAPALLQADRAYQIAAAFFYAGNWDRAREAFQRIGDDPASPWKPYAAYLIARTYIREATLDNNPEALAIARTRLLSLSANPDSKRLLNFVDLRVSPERRLHEISNILTQPRLSTDADQLMTDFLYLFWNQDKTAPRVLQSDSDLLNWLTAWKAPGAAGVVDPVARWRAVKTLPWLIAALHQSSASDAAVPELLNAAHTVPPRSPGYPSVAYYAASLHLARGEKAQARAWDDEALNHPLGNERNRFLAQRFALARNWTEFQRYAPRRLRFLDDSVDNVEPFQPSKFKYANQGVLFDSDSTSAWNYRLALRLWLDAIHGTVLPRGLRAQLARAGWTRAIGLERFPEAAELLSLWKQLDPAGAALALSYPASADPDTARFASTLILLHNAGLEPLVRPGLGRLTRKDRRDEYRDNWWCMDTTEPEIAKLPALPIGAPDLAEGQKERLQLRTAGVMSGASYLAAQAIRHAQAHPDDPKVPEALGLALEAIHYGGCGVNIANETRISREAFNLLKRRYPASEWAKKTKYWYP